jgi:hypothetical protein
MNLQFWEDVVISIEWAMICAMQQVGQSEFLLCISEVESPIDTPHRFTHPVDALNSILRWTTNFLARAVNKDAYVAVHPLIVCTSALDNSIASSALEVLYTLSLPTPSHRNVYTYDTRTMITKFPLLVSPLLDAMYAFSCPGHVSVKDIVSGNSKHDEDDLWKQGKLKYLTDQFPVDTPFFGNCVNTYKYADWVMEDDGAMGNNATNNSSGATSSSRQTNCKDDTLLFVRPTEELDILTVPLRDILRSCLRFGVPVRYRYWLLWRVRIQHQRYLISSTSDTDRFCYHRWLLQTMCVLIITQTNLDAVDSHSNVKCVHEHIDALFKVCNFMHSDIVEVMTQWKSQSSGKYSVLRGLVLSKGDDVSSLIDPEVKRRLFIDDSGAGRFANDKPQDAEIPDELFHMCGELIMGTMCRTDPGHSSKVAFSSFKSLQFQLGLYRFRNVNIAEANEDENGLLPSMFKDELAELTALLSDIYHRRSNFSSAENDNIMVLLPVRDDLQFSVEQFWLMMDLKLRRIEKYLLMFKSAKRLHRILDIWKREELLPGVVKFMDVALKCRCLPFQGSVAFEGIRNSKDVLINIESFLTSYRFMNVEIALGIWLDEFISRSNVAATTFLYDMGGSAIILKRFSLEMQIAHKKSEDASWNQALTNTYQSFILVYLSFMVSLSEIIPAISSRTGHTGPSAASTSVADNSTFGYEWWSSGGMKLQKVTGATPTMSPAPSGEESAHKASPGPAVSFPPNADHGTSPNKLSPMRLLHPSSAGSALSNGVAAEDTKSSTVEVISAIPSHPAMLEAIVRLFSHVAPKSTPIFSCAMAYVTHTISEDPTPPQLLTTYNANQVLQQAWEASVADKNIEHDGDSVTTILDFIDQICYHSIGLALVRDSSFDPFVHMMEILRNPKYLDMESLQLYSDLPLNIGEGIHSILRHYTACTERCFAAVGSHFTTLVEQSRANLDKWLQGSLNESSRRLTDNSVVYGDFSNCNLQSSEYAAFSVAFSSVGFLQKLLDKYSLFQSFNKKYDVVEILLSILQASFSSPTYLLTSLSVTVSSRVLGFAPLVQGVYGTLDNKIMRRQSEDLFEKMLLKMQKYFEELRNVVLAFRKHVTQKKQNEFANVSATSLLAGILNNAPDYNDPPAADETMYRHVHYLNYSLVLNYVCSLAHLLDCISYLLNGLDGSKNRSARRKKDGAAKLKKLVCNAGFEKMLTYLITVFLPECLQEVVAHAPTMRNEGNIQASSGEEDFFIYKIVILSSHVELVADIDGDAVEALALPVGGTLEACLQVNVSNFQDDNSVGVYYRLLHHPNVWIKLFNAKTEEQFDVIAIRRATPEEVTKYRIRETKEAVFALPTYLGRWERNARNNKHECACELGRVSMHQSGFAAFEFIICSIANLLGSVIASVRDDSTLKSLSSVTAFIPRIFEALSVLAPTAANRLGPIEAEQLAKSFNLVNMCYYGMFQHTDLAVLLIYMAVPNDGRYVRSIVSSCFYLIRACALDASVDDTNKRMRDYALCRAGDGVKLLTELIQKCIPTEYAGFGWNRRKSKLDEAIEALFPKYKTDRVREKVLLEIASQLTELLRCPSLHRLCGDLRVRVFMLIRSVITNAIAFDESHKNARDRAPKKSKEEPKPATDGPTSFVASMITGLQNFLTNTTASNSQPPPLLPLPDSERELKQEDIDLIVSLEGELRHEVLSQSSREFLTGLPWALIGEAAAHSNHNAKEMLKEYNIIWDKVGALFWNMGEPLNLTSRETMPFAGKPSGTDAANKPASAADPESSQPAESKNESGSGDTAEEDDDDVWEDVDDDDNDNENEGNGEQKETSAEGEEEDDDANWESASDDSDIASEKAKSEKGIDEEDGAPKVSSQKIALKENKQSSDSANSTLLPQLTSELFEELPTVDFNSVILILRNEAVFCAIDAIEQAPITHNSNYIASYMSLLGSRSIRDNCDTESKTVETYPVHFYDPINNNYAVYQPFIRDFIELHIHELVFNFAFCIGTLASSKYDVCESLLEAERKHVKYLVETPVGVNQRVDAERLNVLVNEAHEQHKTNREQSLAIGSDERSAQLDGRGNLIDTFDLAKADLSSIKSPEFSDPLQAFEKQHSAIVSNSASAPKNELAVVNDKAVDDEPMIASKPSRREMSLQKPEEKRLAIASMILPELLRRATLHLDQICVHINSDDRLAIQEKDESLHRVLLAISFTLLNVTRSDQASVYLSNGHLAYGNCSSPVDSMMMDALTVYLRVHPEFKQFPKLLQNAMKLRVTALKNNVDMDRSLWIAPAINILDCLSHCALFAMDFATTLWRPSAALQPDGWKELVTPPTQYFSIVAHYSVEMNATIGTRRLLDTDTLNASVLEAVTSVYSQMLTTGGAVIQTNAASDSNAAFVVESRDVDTVLGTLGLPSGYIMESMETIETISTLIDQGHSAFRNKSNPYGNMPRQLLVEDRDSVDVTEGSNFSAWNAEHVLQQSCYLYLLTIIREVSLCFAQLEQYRQLFSRMLCQNTVQFPGIASMRSMICAVLVDGNDSFSELTVPKTGNSFKLTRHLAEFTDKLQRGLARISDSTYNQSRKNRDQFSNYSQAVRRHALLLACKNILAHGSFFGASDYNFNSSSLACSSNITAVFQRSPRMVAHALSALLPEFARFDLNKDRKRELLEISTAFENTENEGYRYFGELLVAQISTLVSGISQILNRSHASVGTEYSSVKELELVYTQCANVLLFLLELINAVAVVNCLFLSDFLLKRLTIVQQSHSHGIEFEVHATGPTETSSSAFNFWQFVFRFVLLDTFRLNSAAALYVDVNAAGHLKVCAMNCLLAHLGAVVPAMYSRSVAVSYQQQLLDVLNDELAYNSTFVGQLLAHGEVSIDKTSTEEKEAFERMRYAASVLVNIVYPYVQTVNCSPDLEFNNKAPGGFALESRKHFAYLLCKGTVHDQFNEYFRICASRMSSAKPNSTAGVVDSCQHALRAVEAVLLLVYNVGLKDAYVLQLPADEYARYMEAVSPSSSKKQEKPSLAGFDLLKPVLLDCSRVDMSRDLAADESKDAERWVEHNMLTEKNAKKALLIAKEAAEKKKSDVNNTCENVEPSTPQPANDSVEVVFERPDGTAVTINIEPAAVSDISVSPDAAGGDKLVDGITTDLPSAVVDRHTDEHNSCSNIASVDTHPAPAPAPAQLDDGALQRVATGLMDLLLTQSQQAQQPLTGAATANSSTAIASTSNHHNAGNYSTFWTTALPNAVDFAATRSDSEPSQQLHTSSTSNTAALSPPESTAPNASRINFDDGFYSDSEPSENSNDDGIEINHIRHGREDRDDEDEEEPEEGAVEMRTFTHCSFIDYLCCRRRRHR